MAGTDYGDSLRSTLDAARRQILDLGQSTAAQRLQAVVALGHAEQALSVSESALDRNQRDLAAAYVISGVAVQGGALIQSADQLADFAKTAADSANSALSVAATSIKTLASAFDTLAASIAGVSAIASNDDFGSVMFRSAKKSEDATNQADNTVEQLKAASLVASIQSAKSEAAAAATSVNAVGSEIQGLVDRAGALLGATQQRVNDSVKQRTAAAQAKRAVQTTYRQVKIDSEALDDGTTSMDGVLNGSLAVTPVITSADPTQKATYTLKATYTIPYQSGDVCYFFALLEHDATGFSYNDAKTAVVEFGATSPGASLTKVTADPNAKAGDLVTYTTSIQTTTTGDSIAAGQSYQVFALHVPKGGPYATNASDLSYPSRSTPVAPAIPDQEKCKIDFLKLPEKPEKTDTTPPIIFKVQVQAPSTAASHIMEYRAFLLLEDVYQAIRAVHDDTVLFAGLLAPSSYKSWVRKSPSASASTSTSTSARASTTPSEPAGGLSENPVFVYREGDTDAYGDIVTPGTNYELLVLLVPRDETMKSALLPAVPFKTSSPVPTVMPPSPPSAPQAGPPSSPGAPPSHTPARGAVADKLGTTPAQATAPGAQATVPASAAPAAAHSLVVVEEAILVNLMNHESADQKAGRTPAGRGVK